MSENYPKILGIFALFVIHASVQVLASPSPSFQKVLGQTYARNEVDDLAISGFEKLGDHLNENPHKCCSLKNAAVRREWSDLSFEERKDYIRAVLCLQRKPSKFSTSECPGCRSRFDDFSAVHIQRTDFIHGTTNFLTWHRYFLWAYEQTLRNECGYRGYHPYWNWDRYADDPVNSPLFDGSPVSMGGNGKFEEYDGINVAPEQVMPQAAGGGCVTTGPFKDMVVTLGPSQRMFFPKMPQIPPNPRDDALGYNPRCLRRDVHPGLAAYTKANITSALIAESEDIESFQAELQKPLGVHAAGHLVIGGDPGGDFYVGASDPMFFLHHGEIDRVYWTWQNHGLPERLETVAGTITFRNNPPSRNGTLDDVIEMGNLAPKATIRDLMSTTGGLRGYFCYVYAQ